VSVQPWYCCLSLKVVEVGDLVHGFMLQGLGQEDSAGRERLGDEQSELFICIDILTTPQVLVVVVALLFVFIHQVFCRLEN
jgi:hypothetical protein